jgi:hypothetical protein
VASKNQPKTPRGDREKILTELRAICFGNLAGLIDKDGEIIRPDDKDPRWKTIKKIKTTTFTPKDGSYTKTTLEIESYDKLQAINLLAKIEGIDGLANMIKAIRGAGFDIIESEGISTESSEVQEVNYKPVQGSLFDNN